MHAVAPSPDLRAENTQLRGEIESLLAQNRRARAENERLRSENHGLRAMLDAHVARARSTTMFGPLELTAGTCLGPGRHEA